MNANLGGFMDERKVSRTFIGIIIILACTRKGKVSLSQRIVRLLKCASDLNDRLAFE